MFSKALRILDYNTTLYMIEEMRKEVENLKKERAEQVAIQIAVLKRKEEELAALEEENRRLRELLEKKNEEG